MLLNKLRCTLWWCGSKSFILVHTLNISLHFRVFLILFPNQKLIIKDVFLAQFWSGLKVAATIYPHKTVEDNSLCVFSIAQTAPYG